MWRKIIITATNSVLFEKLVGVLGAAPRLVIITNCCAAVPGLSAHWGSTVWSLQVLSVIVMVFSRYSVVGLFVTLHYSLVIWSKMYPGTGCTLVQDALSSRMYPGLGCTLV